jgi:hypothetical protein
MCEFGDAVGVDGCEGWIREVGVRGRIWPIGLGLVIVAALGVWRAPGGDVARAALDCSIFASQADAQAVLDTGPIDPSTIDPDGNGMACDELLEGAPEEDAEGSDGTSVDGATPAGASPTPVPTPAVSLPTLLPSVEEAPVGVVVERDEERTRDDVAYQLAGQSLDEAALSGAADRLDGWGFESAVVRYYLPDQTPLPEAPDQPPPPPPSGIVWLWVAAYRFGSPDLAGAAFDGLTEAALAADERLRATEIAEVGERTEAFTSGDADGLFHVWVQIGFDVVWIAGTASGEFPRADAEALARSVVQRASGEGPGAGLRTGGIATPVTGANLRAEPSTAAAVVTILPPGVPLVVTGDAVSNEGRDWWPVEVIATGEVGWVAAELLAPL